MNQQEFLNNPNLACNQVLLIRIIKRLDNGLAPNKHRRVECRSRINDDKVEYYAPYYLLFSAPSRDDNSSYFAASRPFPSSLDPIYHSTVNGIFRSTHRLVLSLLF